MIVGTQTSDCATGTIIGSNTGVYIGGLPKDFIISREERDPRARVRETHHQHDQF